MFLVCWILVFLAAGYDTGFFWLHSRTAAEWELNPAAALLVGNLGPAGVVMVKLAGLLFAALLAWHLRESRPALARLLTFAAAAAYLTVAAFYVAT